VAIRERRESAALQTLRVECRGFVDQYMLQCGVRLSAIVTAVKIRTWRKHAPRRELADRFRDDIDARCDFLVGRRASTPNRRPRSAPKRDRRNPPLSSPVTAARPVHRDKAASKAAGSPNQPA
jgi:hypothetical protein